MIELRFAELRGVELRFAELRLVWSALGPRVEAHQVEMRHNE